MIRLLKWTKALEQEFFSKNRDDEVFLYLSDEIINRIGEKHGLGGVASFLETVLVPREQRQDLYLKLARTPNSAENRKIKGRSILDFAVLLNEKNNQNIPFSLLYAALVMYIGNEAIENNKPIGQYIIRYLKTKLDDNGDYSAISTLFEQVNRKFPSFNNKLRTDEAYIGLIKYQLILSPREISELEQALYRIQYDDHDYSNFIDKVNRIHDYVPDQLKRKLIEAINDKNYQERFSTIFRNFDAEDYTAQHNVEGIRQSAEFALVLDFSSTDGRRGFHLVSNYRPNEHVVVGNFELSPSIDSLGPYSNRYVVHGGSDYVRLGEYRLTGDNVEISSISLGNVIQFYKQSEGIYLQSRGHISAPLYVMVRLNHVEEWEAWARTHARNLRRLDEQFDVSDLTSGEWAFYCVDALMKSYYDDDNEQNAATLSAEIIRKESIRQVGKKDTYLVNALPYFEFPNEINQSELRLTVWIEADRALKERRELSKNDYKVLVDGRRMMLDITADIDYSRSSKVEVEIKYSDSSLGELTKEESFYVSGQQIAYAQENLFRYDCWGDLIEAQSDAYIQGNKINSNTTYPIGTYRHPISLVDQVSDESFYFINLLASTMYMENDAKITRERLRKCIRYASTRDNININSNGFTTKTVNLLVNCGYVAVDYASSKYQAIPPCFSKIPRSFSENNTEQVWMLTGTYTRMFLDNLRKYCSERDIKVKYKYSDKISSSAGYLKLLPPIVLIGGRFSPEDFMNVYPVHKFDYYRDLDYACSIISMAGRVSRYEETLSEIPREEMAVNLVRTDTTLYPRIREDNPGAYNNHKCIELSEDGAFLRPTVGRDWCSLYCHYRRRSPFIVKGENHIYIPEDLHLPSIIQRSLFSMNVGIASYKKAFICNYDSEDRAYTTVKSYAITSAGLDILKDKLTENNEELFIRKTRSDNNRWKYEVEIWHRKNEIDSSEPKTLYVLNCVSKSLTPEITVSAVALYDKGRLCTFAPTRGVFTRVKNYNCNRLFSSLITDGTFNNNQIEFDEVTLSLPNKEKYNIEGIIIL